MCAYRNDFPEQERVFRCNFTVSLLSRLFVWIPSAILLAITLLIADGTVFILVAAAFCLIAPFLWELQMHNIRNKSFICLTADGKMTIKVWPGCTKSYPVDRIEEVRVVDFSSADAGIKMKDCLPPVSFDRGDGLLPKQGVLVFFERKYIKSVRPVFLNPADPELFASALAEARDRLKR